jgi:hypothetical protein
MSSNTEFRFVPRVVHSVDATGRQAVDLSQAIGKGAAQVLKSTLNDIESARQSLAPAMQGMVAWEKEQVSGPSERYRLQVPAFCRPQGVDQLEISLEIRGAVAEIRHTSHYSVINEDPGAARPAIQEQIRQAVNRSVNQLLAVSVAQRVKQQVQQYVRPALQNQVQVTVTPQFNIRTQAFVRR